MDNATGQSSSPITGQVLFYKKPEPLSTEAHGNLGVTQIDQPFAFLRQAHAVPVTVTEFGLTAASFPIIFMGDELTPIAVMGVNQGQNLYVGADGQPDQEYYIPAFVRRYPFVFATDDANDRLLLCVDREAPMVTENPQIPFFENGEASKFTNDAIEFCKEFERQRRATQEFIALLKKMDLMEQKTVSFQPRDANGAEVGPNQKIADYMAVSEQKLNELSDEQYNELRANGALGAIYAHLVSLLNWQRVIQRAVRAASQQTAGNA